MALIITTLPKVIWEQAASQREQFSFMILIQ